MPPGEATFWYGDAGLWTALPNDGQWSQLTRGEKVWWWSEGFDAREEPAPDLVLTARRLDGVEGELQFADATHGYQTDLGSAMLVGVRLPGAGCWELTARYKGHRLSFVVQVPSE